MKIGVRSFLLSYFMGWHCLRLCVRRRKRVIRGWFWRLRIILLRIKCFYWGLIWIMNSVRTVRPSFGVCFKHLVMKKLSVSKHFKTKTQSCSLKPRRICKASKISSSASKNISNTWRGNYPLCYDKKRPSWTNLVKHLCTQTRKNIENHNAGL